jgi:hypothetical protein
MPGPATVADPADELEQTDDANPVGYDLASALESMIDRTIRTETDPDMPALQRAFRDAQANPAGDAPADKPVDDEEDEEDDSEDSDEPALSSDDEDAPEPQAPSKPSRRKQKEQERREADLAERQAIIAQYEAERAARVKAENDLKEIQTRQQERHQEALALVGSDDQFEALRQKCADNEASFEERETYDRWKETRKVADIFYEDAYDAVQIDLADQALKVSKLRGIDPVRVQSERGFDALCAYFYQTGLAQGKASDRQVAELQEQVAALEEQLEAVKTRATSGRSRTP